VVTVCVGVAMSRRFDLVEFSISVVLLRVLKVV
jgi:hypothetical protein